MSGENVGRSFRVEGVVQGVGFRWFTKEIAVALGASGWVANRADGSVHGEVFGSADVVAKFLAAIERGPTLGRVTKVESAEIECEPGTGFEILKND